MGQLYEYPEIQRMEGKNVNEYFASLVKFFNGLYIRIYAQDEMIVRQWLNREMRGLWCSVYPAERFDEIRNKYNGQVIGPAIMLTEEDGVIYENY